MHLETVFMDKSPGEVRTLLKPRDVVQVNKQFSALHEWLNDLGVVVWAEPRIEANQATIIYRVNFPTRHVELDIPQVFIASAWRVMETNPAIGSSTDRPATPKGTIRQPATGGNENE